jgi:hypothetical protein
VFHADMARIPTYSMLYQGFHPYKTCLIEPHPIAPKCAAEETEPPTCKISPPYLSTNFASIDSRATHIEYLIFYTSLNDSKNIISTQFPQQLIIHKFYCPTRHFHFYYWDIHTQIHQSPLNLVKGHARFQVI